LCWCMRIMLHYICHIYYQEPYKRKCFRINII
jgi:hypothetical protein